MARRHNTTGIKGLSIGTTKNTKQQIIKRYVVNWKEENPKSKSFYFGVNKLQKDAFYTACFFMIDNELTDLREDELSKIYADFKHEAVLI